MPGMAQVGPQRCDCVLFFLSSPFAFVQVVSFLLWDPCPCDVFFFLCVLPFSVVLFWSPGWSCPGAVAAPSVSVLSPLDRKTSYPPCSFLAKQLPLSTFVPSFFASLLAQVLKEMSGQVGPTSTAMVGRYHFSTVLLLFHLFLYLPLSLHLYITVWISSSPLSQGRLSLVAFLFLVPLLCIFWVLVVDARLCGRL